MRRFLSVAARATAGASLVAAAAVSVDPSSRAAAVGLWRFFRAGATALACAVDSRVTDVPALPPAAAGPAQAALDARCAARVLSLCGALGGVYVKLTQFTSAHPALRPSLSAPLSVLQDRAPPRPLSELEGLLREELRGAPVFAAVEPVAIAAASIAQVHRAWLRDGTPVAVKVQYPELRATAAADLAALRALFSVAAFFYEDLRYLIEMLPEFEQTMRAELSFGQEARNAERVRAMTERDPRYHVPKVYTTLSTDRVLVQEFVSGQTLAAALRDGGLLAAAPAAAKRALAATVADFFAQALFVDGFVHCDPHPGNIMVTACPDGNFQLTFIDWGMVRRLTPHFRRAHCALWTALLAQDKPATKAAMTTLGLREGDADALSLMLTFRRAEGGSVLGAALTAEQLNAMREDYKDVTPADFQAFALRLPRDIFFVLRTAALVRGVNKQLGGTSRERFLSWGAGALRGAQLSRAVGPLREAANAARAGGGVEMEAPAVAPLPTPPPAMGGSHSAAAAAAALLGALRAVAAAPPAADASGGGGGLLQQPRGGILTKPQAPGEGGWATESECLRERPPAASLASLWAWIFGDAEVFCFGLLLWAFDLFAATKKRVAPATAVPAGEAGAATPQSPRRSKLMGEMG
jgi:aarF domain-containing kinase